jgi:hypothetical protein
MKTTVPTLLLVAGLFSLPLLATGCGGPQLVLKGPLTDKCTDAGLAACPEIVDGFLAYVDGKKPEGKEKLEKAAAENSPEKVKSFAGTLQPLLGLPGVSSYTRPFKEIVDLLADGSKAKHEPEKSQTRPMKAADAAPIANEASRSAPKDRRLEDALEPEGESPAAAKSPDSNRGGGALRASSTDYTRIRTRTVVPSMDAKAIACSPMGGPACARVPVFIGPFVVTDLYAPGGCGDELFVYADKDDSRGWIISASTGGGLNLQGGQLVVPADEKLYVGARSQKASLRHDPSKCAVTFSGWRPD